MHKLNDVIFSFIITLHHVFFQVLYEHKLTSFYRLCEVAEVLGENSLTFLTETISLLWLSVLVESTLLPLFSFFFFFFFAWVCSVFCLYSKCCCSPQALSPTCNKYPCYQDIILSQLPVSIFKISNAEAPGWLNWFISIRLFFFFLKFLCIYLF